MPQNRTQCAGIERSTCSIFIADFGVSQLFIYQSSNGFQHWDRDLMGVVSDSEFSVAYFFIPLQQ